MGLAQITGDIVGETIGDWGKWQRRATILIFLCKIPAAWFMACVIFTAPYASDDEYFCKTKLQIANDSFWKENEEVDNCYQTSMTSMDSFVSDEKEVLKCHEFVHHSSYDSLVTQFDLVCDRKILIAVTQFSHLFGVLLGGIIATHLLNFVSPRKVMLIGMITQIICGCLTGLRFSFIFHTLFRCVAAICCGQMYTAGQVIFSDITGGIYRKSVICLFETFWGIGVILLPLIAFYFPSWSSIYIAISLPTILYMFLWHWIPDSPRWWLMRDEIVKAKNILLAAAEYNDRRKSVPKDLDYRLRAQAALSLLNRPTSSWFSLWSDGKSVVLMIALHTAWAVYVTNYNGMLLNIRAFDRKYLMPNTIIAGLSEIVGVLIAWIFIVKMPNSKWMCTGMFNIFTGIISSVALYIDETEFDEIVYVVIGMTLAMLSKISTTCSQTVLVTCTNELISSSKQKICIFSCIVWARIWLLTAPFIGAMTFLHNLFPLCAFAWLGLAGGICTCVVHYLQRWKTIKNDININVFTISK